MKPSRFFAYAAAIVAIAGGAIWYIISDYYARKEQIAQTDENQVIMYKNPNCQCCTKWADHMEQAGFTVTAKPTNAMASVKADHGVPYDMGSCHTAVVEGYVIEGHVPAKEVKKLLAERPQATGLSVPGMPIGSPGMEQGNRSEAYDVLLFSGDQQQVYASY